MLCLSQDTYQSLRKTYPEQDNVLYYIRPIECSMQYGEFKHMGGPDNFQTFRENCVDFDRGDPKP